ncbi:hypothetical protein GALMADRAFT_246388 [Galerina marginata CBS 339.88]|uniref:Uncharacterized protein n=1 Tax=Galerina marginata (strain CBS 339.88) TaxID=685588 RepID=A0A067TB79_GALM3|nr:hypothetical protein GALMADRAFT_246388 [Galerina marginata CBS 339.88]
MRLLKCPELRLLAKSTRFTSVQWRNQTPGSLDPFFVSTTFGSSLVVDPSHPAAGVAKIKFPIIRAEAIGVKLLPMGLLLRELRPFPATPILTWTERVQWAKKAGLTGKRNSVAPNIPPNSSFDLSSQLYPERDYNSLLIPARRIIPQGALLDLALERAARRVPMSLHISTSKKRMGQFRYMRRHIEKRIRAAINMIVTKGAHTSGPDETIQFDANDAGRKWVLQGWAYMFYPTTEIYNMTYAKLISKLRTTLKNVNQQAIRMENNWLNKSLLSDQLAADLGAITNLRNAVSTEAPYSELHSSLSVDELTNLPTFEPALDGYPRKEANSSKTTAPIEKDDLHIPTTSTSKLPRAPSKVFAGKEPEAWKRELLEGLDMIVERLPRGRNQLSSKSPASTLCSEHIPNGQPTQPFSSRGPL